MAGRIVDEAIAVRGGRCAPDDFERAFGTHPSGISGVSVECDVGVLIETLASIIPHGRIGVTTLAVVRRAGGDVVRTSARGTRR